MIDLETARSTNSKLTQQDLTCVFTGGTSGIGEYAIRALAKHQGTSSKGLRVYIVGRNREAARTIIEDCSKICPNGTFIFIKANDLSLLKDVDRCCEEISAQEKTKGNAKIDLLVMSHADLHFGGRRETEEGLDKTMSFLYYSRMRFITQLLPILRSSTLQAHVISIFGAGLEKNLPNWHPDDLSLRQTGNYNMSAARTHVIVMTTFFFEALAKQNAGHLSLVHEFPNLVMTPAFKSASHPWWFKLIWTLVSPVIHFFRPVISADETGERVLFLASGRFPPRESESSGATEDEVAVASSTDGVRGGGAYSVKHTGQTNDIEETYVALRKEGFAEKIRKHTTDVFAAVENEKIFEG